MSEKTTSIVPTSWPSPYYAGSSTATSTRVRWTEITNWTPQGNLGDPIIFYEKGPWMYHYGIYLVNYDVTAKPATSDSFVSIVLLQDENELEGVAVGAITSNSFIKLSGTAMVNVSRALPVMPSYLSIRMQYTGPVATAPPGTGAQVANMTVTLLVDEGRA